MIRVAAFVGDYYHPAELIRQSLERALAPEVEVGTTELRFEDVDRLPVVLEERPDAVILFKENRLNPTDSDIRTWMSEAAANAIVRYVERGGGWLAWHSGLASYPTEGPYVSMLRGHFEYHPAQHRPVRYRPAADGTFLPEGETMEFPDEHYFVKVDTDRTAVFLLSGSADGNSISGWHHPFGAGRVLCLTPAHTREGLLGSGLQAVVRQAVAWVVGGRADR